MRRFFRRPISVLLLVVLATGCGAVQAESLPAIDLGVRTPLPEMAATTEIQPLRLAVAAILSPMGTADSYRTFANYLGEAIGRPVELIQRRTYAETNALIAAGEVDLAFVCTSAYVEGLKDASMDLLVAPIIEGQTVYYSDLIVATSHPALSMADLRGSTFAFTDPMSLSGRVYPTHLVQQMGEEPSAFFSTIFFTYSHDRAIEAVAAGVADGAAVDSLVLRHALRRDPALAGKVKVIHRSPPFGIPPVVVPASLPLRQRAHLQNLLLTMHEDPAGRAILNELGIDRFVTMPVNAYDQAGDLVRRTPLETLVFGESGR